MKPEQIIRELLDLIEMIEMGHDLPDHEFEVIHDDLINRAYRYIGSDHG